MILSLRVVGIQYNMSLKREGEVCVTPSRECSIFQRSKSTALVLLEVRFGSLSLRPGNHPLEQSAKFQS